MFSGVQALTDEDLQALSSLVRLRELSLSGGPWQSAEQD